MRPTVRERLHRRLRPCPDEGCQCLLWTGCLNSRGYGCIGVNGKTQLVHRVAWELDKGPVPDGLTIDHVHDRGCRHKNCANVAHMEPVTGAENIRRSAPRRIGKPHPKRRKEFDLGDDFWRRFSEWAGPQEWAAISPENRARALALATTQ